MRDCRPRAALCNVGELCVDLLPNALISEPCNGGTEGVLTENLSRLLGRPAEVVPVPLALSYPQRILAKEGSKGLIGSVACVCILYFLRPTPYLGWPIAAAGVLFLLYLGQQVSRHYLRSRVDDTGFIHETFGIRKAIRWAELSDLRLNFYPQSKGQSQGMLVLILKDGKSRIKLDSTIDHFPTVLSRAAEAARERGIQFHPTTEENLASLGL